jgi:enoyl-CoA hydratase
MVQESVRTTGSIDVAVEDGIATVIINQPGRRNALNLAMWDELARVIPQLDGDPAVRVMILRGAGTVAFSAGADISEFPEHRSTPQQALVYNRRAAAASEALIHTQKPLIAMIYGFCVGGGCELALGCDLRIASDEAVFGIPAARLGISYSHADIKRLVDIVGPSNAKMIFFTGDPRIPARRAYDMGLVNEVVPSAQLERRAMELAGQIMESAPSSVRWAKQAVEVVLRDPALTSVPDSDEAAAQLFGSADFKEGLAAFFEKRKPRFRWE